MDINLECGAVLAVAPAGPAWSQIDFGPYQIPNPNKPEPSSGPISPPPPALPPPPPVPGSSGDPVLPGDPFDHLNEHLWIGAFTGGLDHPFCSGSKWEE